MTYHIRDGAEERRAGAARSATHAVAPREPSASPRESLTLSNTLAGGASVAFTDTYTPAHQLEAETVSNPDYVFPAPAASSSYAAVNALNQYPSIDGGAVGWDANGNLGSLAGGAYAHDPENRLVKAGGNTAYGYDPLGRRVARNQASTVPPVWGTPTWGSFTWTAAAPTATTYLHDGDAEIAEYDTSGALIRRFVPGAAIDEPLAMITAAGSTTFFHTDRKGSVIAMADTSGARVEGPYTYDAYGNCFVGASTTSCTTLPATAEPFRYTGQRFDPDTGLYYYRARYHVPTIGRFAETDPAGYAPDVNWYAYVGNDPVDGADPNGLCTSGDGASHVGTAPGSVRACSDDDPTLRGSRASKTKPTAAINSPESVDRHGIGGNFPPEPIGSEDDQELVRLSACAEFGPECAIALILSLGGDTPVHQLPSPALDQHHIFPQQFREYFRQHGIDIDHYTATVGRTTHLRGIHGSGLGNMPGRYNEAWRKFIESHPNATAKEIFQFGGHLMDQYGINAVDIGPYGAARGASQ